MSHCCNSHHIQVLSDHLVSTLDSDSAEGFRPPKPGKEADWASWLPFPVVAVICESDAGLANAGGPSALLCHLPSCVSRCNRLDRHKFEWTPPREYMHFSMCQTFSMYSLDPTPFNIYFVHMFIWAVYILPYI